MMSTHRPLRASLFASTALLALLATPALANPTGGTVVAGDATLRGEGTKTVTVEQRSNRAVINWQDFSIREGETTRFVQPDATAIALNRVTGGKVSEIFGALEANGRVFLINRSGAVFGHSAKVDVGGLVVSTADLDTAAFMSGSNRLRFDVAGNADAAILNNGTITASDAGIVAFVAPRVANHGIIRANMGRIALGASSRFTLDLAGDGLIQFAPNDGFESASSGPALEADGKILAHGGSVYLTANAAREAINASVQVRGQVAAGRAEVGSDGSIQLLSGKAGTVSIASAGMVTVEQDAVIDASGTTAGRVAISGGTVSQEGQIRANGAAEGGEITLAAEGLLHLGGEILADGGAGRGGTIDLVAGNRLIATTASRLSADGAQGGQVQMAGGTGAGQGLFSSGSVSVEGRAGNGGSVEILGRDIALVAASVNADGATGGGTIAIGHQRSATGALEVTAETVELSPATTLSASALARGDGGVIEVWSNQTTRAWGATNARGGSSGGDGGFIELSSKGEVVFGGSADAGAARGAAGTLLLDPRNLTIDDAAARFPQYQLLDPNPNAGNRFGEHTVVLPNDHVVVTAQGDDFGATDAGAVYLFHGTTGALISALTGSSANDRVGYGGVTVLTNGNYVVHSYYWANGAATNAGAVTWGDGTRGITGAVSAGNSLVGTSAGDLVGIGGVTALTNGNYVVRSYYWANGAATNAGAVTWGDGETGITGAVSAANSLVGSQTNDRVGIGGVTALTNGNYVVRSDFWANGAAAEAGAVTWGDGETGITGAVSASNSLVGSQTKDRVGSDGVTVLTNGHYVVSSHYWANGAAAEAGAVTWGDGTRGITGAVSASNSLVGSQTKDRVGYGGVTVLTNGNYVVRSSYWANGAATNAGAVTWGDGTTGIVGAVSASNSLVGTRAGDLVGIDGVTALTNGNYVVTSGSWNNNGISNAGAATWGDGSTGIVGTISASNSLVGSQTNDRVGYGGVAALANGHYVVSSDNWANGAAAYAGAVTWGDGTRGIAGVVSASNSLVGSQTNDRVGLGGVTALANGHYVVSSYNWANGAATNAGAVTWGDGTRGITGAVSASNSLVGSQTNDRVGLGGVTALANGNYVVRSEYWNNGAATQAGAVTWGDGTRGITGAVSIGNSLVGTTANAQLIYRGQLSDGTILAASSTDGDSGRVYVGLPDASLLTYGRAQGQDMTIGSAAITRVLDTGTHLVLQASNDITVKSALRVNNPNGNGGSLTLQAGRSIAIDNLITTDNGNLTLIANDRLASGVIDADRLAGAARITFGAAGGIDAGSGTVLLEMRDGAGLTHSEAGTLHLTNIRAGTLTAIHSGNGANASVQVDGTVTASGSGDAIVISGPRFINTAGAGALSLTGGGRFLVYSEDWEQDTRDGLEGSNLYNRSYGAHAPTTITHAGNRFLYTRQPVLNVVINDATREYGLANPEFTAMVTGLVNGDTASGTLRFTTDATQGSNVGRYAIRLDAVQTSDIGYAFNVTDGSLDITKARLTVTANDATREYGLANPTFSARISGLRNGDTEAVINGLTLASTASQGSNVRRYAITASGATATNYDVDYVAGSLAITKARLTVTANDATREYGLANPGFSARISGLRNGDTEAVINGLQLASTASQGSNVGRYAIVASGATATNYDFDYVAGSLAITKARLTVTANDATREYGLANPAFSARIDGLRNGDTEAVINGLQLASTASQGSNVGRYAIVASGATATNYDVDYVAGSLDITKARLTVTANDATREYGLANPGFSARISGLRNGDTEAVINGLQLASTASQGSNVGRYAITASGATATNYDVDYVAGSLDITKARLTVTANDATREYGLANPGFSARISGLRNGDTESVINGLQLTTTADAQSLAGTYDIVPSSATARNYDFQYVNGTLTVTASTVVPAPAPAPEPEPEPVLRRIPAELERDMGEPLIRFTHTRHTGEENKASANSMAVSCTWMPDNAVVSAVPGLCTAY